MALQLSPQGRLQAGERGAGRTGEVRPGRPPGWARAGRSCARRAGQRCRWAGGTVALPGPAPPRGHTRTGMLVPLLSPPSPFPRAPGGHLFPTRSRGQRAVGFTRAPATHGRFWIIGRRPSHRLTGPGKDPLVNLGQQIHDIRPLKGPRVPTPSPRSPAGPPCRSALLCPVSRPGRGRPCAAPGREGSRSGGVPVAPREQHLALGGGRPAPRTRP